MKNKLTDLNDHLFSQLERLNDEGLSPEQVESEIKRSKAMSSVASQVVSNASLVFEAEKAHREGLVGGNKSLLLGHKALDN